MQIEGAIITSENEISRSRKFRFTDKASFLLSLVSGVDEEKIRTCSIYRRNPYRYFPWYRASRGGGAITFGSRNWSSITFTENFFSEDNKFFNNRAYGNRMDIWLSLAAHEVVHIRHAQRFGNFVIYLLVFAYQYLLHGHDKAPLEIEAEEARFNFLKFNAYFTSKEGKTLSQLLLDNDNNFSSFKQVLSKNWEEFKSN